MESASAVVKDEPVTEFEAVQCVKQEWTQDMEPSREAESDDPFRCVEQDTERRPDKVDLLTVWVPGRPVKQECPEDNEEVDDYSVSASKVEPKIEISVEDHCISAGEGSDAIQSASLEEDFSTPASCSPDDTPSHSSVLSDNSDQWGCTMSPLEGSNTTKRKSNRNEEVPRHRIVDRTSHIEQGAYNSKAFCDYGSRYYGPTFINECPESEKSFRVHLKLHSGANENNCADETDSGDHVKFNSNELDHKCEECGKYFTQRGHLRNHLKIHTGEKDHKCTECGKCFTQSGNLRNHLKIHSGEKEHKCTECGKCFTLSGNLRNHLKIHLGAKDYKCTECGKCFTHSASLRDHLKIHSGRKDHKCSICGKCFTHSSSLRNHLKIHTGQKDHKCSECGKCFTDSCALKQHFKIHTGVKDHKCVQCGKCFNQSGHLKNHLKIHSGQKDHKCSECGKCFTHIGDLRIHLKIHLGKRDFKCTQCVKCFTHSYALKRHLKTHSVGRDHQ